MEEWKRARAMMKASLTILTDNYKEEFIIGDVCTGLRGLIEHIDNLDNLED